jgi:protein-tyrosine phosphatase
MEEKNMGQGFIDLHTHILPGVDDGSRSMEQTVRMLQIAYDEGIRTIIATPHYIAGAKNLTPEQLKLICSQVQDEAWKIDRDMKILLGNEIYYSESVLEALQSGTALTLAGSRYVLVEFSPKETFNNIFRGLTRLTGAGYLPIIAHIERYRCLYKKEDSIVELHGLGCYLQMNCNSLLGGILDTEAMYHRKLIQLGLIHFLGSDCHDDQIRIPCMMKAKKRLHKRCDEGMLSKLFYEHPLKVLENTYI